MVVANRRVTFPFKGIPEPNPGLLLGLFIIAAQSYHVGLLLVIGDAVDVVGGERLQAPCSVFVLLTPPIEEDDEKQSRDRYIRKQKTYKMGSGERRNLLVGRSIWKEVELKRGRLEKK